MLLLTGQTVSMPFESWQKIFENEKAILQAAIRATRYLMGTLDNGMKFTPLGTMNYFDVFSDMDWAS